MVIDGYEKTAMLAENFHVSKTVFSKDIPTIITWIYIH
jgi:hypothetical protein